MKLIITNGTEEHAFDIQPGVMVLGRGSSCHVKLKSHHVSRRHFECERNGDEVVVRDLGSSNGTYVNGIRISEPVVLKEGDKIAMGDIAIRFQAGNDAGPAAFSPAAEAGPAAEQIRQEYSEDEPTPPDGTFLPEVYSPEGPPQPILTQRDGRWFVRDPRTNREIEIAPKGETAAAARDKNKKLMTYAIIAGAALLAVILVTMAMSGNRQPMVAPTSSQYPRAQYNKMVDDAIKASENGKADHAIDMLNKADLDRPQIKVAGILRDILEARKKSGENMVDLDYEKVITLLDELERLAQTTAARAYARSQLNKVERMQRDLTLIGRARSYEANGDFVAAYDAIRMIPAGSPVRLANEDYVRELRDACRLDFVAKGERTMAEGKWDDAIAHLNEAMNYAPSVPHKKEIIGKMSRCVEGKTDQKALTDAAAKFEAEEYAPAITLLQQIDDKSHYAAMADALRESIQQAMDHNEVLSLYMAGQARKAIELIRERDLKSMVGLADKAQRVLQAFAAAEQADKPGRRGEAIAAYKTVLGLEPDPDNYYHRISEERFQELNDPRALAKEYLRKGDDALKNDEIEAAREYYERAEALDPGSAAGPLKLLDNEARRRYIKGTAEKSEGNKQAAIKLFQQAMKYAKPGSRYYNLSQQELHSMK